MHLHGTCLALAGVLVQTVTANNSPEWQKTRNFIYIVPDGYGQASQVLARDYHNLKNGIGEWSFPKSSPIGVEHLVIGSVRTQSLNNLITDSAASATAFSCGVKTNNSRIAVDGEGLPVGSILEAAHLSGFKTGLVVTSRITHATPACYASHVLDRDFENIIAIQEIGYTHPLGSVVDILMGGGRRHFLPSSKGGERADGIDLIKWATEEAGFTYVSDKNGFKKALGNGTLPLPFLGLYSSSHMSYELDRDDDKQPSLLEMVSASLTTLEKASSNSTKGFFIMIEASRIDHAGHANDAVAHVHDTLMFNKVIDHVRSYIDKHPDTQMLSAADHECGGLTLEDGYDPTVLSKAEFTTEHLMKMVDEYDGDDEAGYLKETILPLYGLKGVSDEQVSNLLQIKKASGTSAMGRALGRIGALEAGLNWSSESHSAVDVALHGYAAGAAYRRMREMMGTNHDNTALPGYIEKVLGLNISKVTDALREKGVDWFEDSSHLKAIKRSPRSSHHHHD